MIPDPMRKTVLIPIRIKDGEINFFYGGKLPKLKEGTIGDLVVPSFFVIDKRKLALLERVDTKVFLKKSTSLMVQINPLNEDAKEGGIEWLQIIENYTKRPFVEVVLKEDLEIELRGTKKGELENCPCSIPSLPKTQPESINHAYTLISQHYETHRRSHSGNVFDKVFFRNEKNLLKPLKNLRKKFEIEYEQELILLNNDWFHKKGPDSSTDNWAIVLQKAENMYFVLFVNQQSKIINQENFSKKSDAINWLITKNFIEYDFDEFPSEIKPPCPPYQKDNDEKVWLTIY